MGVLHDTKYDQGWNREIIAGLHWLTISPTTVGTSSDGKGKTTSGCVVAGFKPFPKQYGICSQVRMEHVTILKEIKTPTKNNMLAHAPSRRRTALESLHCHPAHALQPVPRSFVV